jgi:short-subunit dehydrogenase involved in D-alanine esterification of teichoic acids
MNTSGHRVLITGGSKGIGFALARQFHKEGNQVVLVGRDEAALVAAEMRFCRTFKNMGRPRSSMCRRCWR